MKKYTLGEYSLKLHKELNRYKEIKVLTMKRIQEKEQELKALREYLIMEPVTGINRTERAIDELFELAEEGVTHIYDCQAD